MSAREFATGRLIRHHLRSGALASVFVAILVAVAVLVASLAPRALTVLADDELHHSIGELSPVRRDLAGSTVFGYQPNDGSAPVDAEQTFGPTGRAIDELESRLSEPLASLLGTPEWVVRTGQRKADPVGVEDPLAHPMLGLAIDLGWQDRVEFVDGAAPAAWTGREPAAPGFGQPAPAPDPDAPPNPPIEVALSADAADAASLEVGDVLDFEPADLLVAGIYEPIDLDDPYWDHAVDLAVGAEYFSADSGKQVYASAYIDPETAVRMRDTLAAAQLSVWYPVDTATLSYDQAPRASEQLRQLESTGRNLPTGELLAFTTGLPEAIEAVAQRVTLLTALIALAVSGPIGVVLAVFALGVQSVVERRRAALALGSARGASSAQLRLLMVIEGLVIVVPAAVVGIGLASVILPVAVGLDSVALPILLAAAPPILFAISTSPRSLRPTRGDLRVRARGGVRWVVEVAIVGIAAVALYLLFRRGLAESSLVVGVDPLLVLTPLLLSLAVCVLVLRLYPGLMLAVQRASRRRRGAVALVGAARAVRAPALGFIAALALIVGISIAVFSTTLSSTVATALATDARLTVGADVRVDADVLSPEVADAVAGLDGVARVVPVQRAARVDLGAGGSTASVTIVIADTAALHEVRPDLPVRPAGADGIQLFASSDLADFVKRGDLTLEGKPATLAAVLPEGPLVNIDRSWIIVDTADAVGVVVPEFEAGELFVDLEGTGVTSATPELRETVESFQDDKGRERVLVLSAGDVVDDALAEPVIGGLNAALWLSALTATVLSALAVVLASIAAGPVRNRLIGVLRILGMAPRQVSGLIAWELVPIAITAIVAGTLLGLAELVIVMAALDLRPFLTGALTPTASVDAPLVAIVVTGFAIAVAAAGFVAVAIGRRFSPASSVKIGAE